MQCPPLSPTYYPPSHPHAADMNFISDNDLQALIAPLADKPGVKFTMVAGGW